MQDWHRIRRLLWTAILIGIAVGVVRIGLAWSDPATPDEGTDSRGSSRRMLDSVSRARPFLQRLPAVRPSADDRWEENDLQPSLPHEASRIRPILPSGQAKYQRTSWLNPESAASAPRTEDSAAADRPEFLPQVHINPAPLETFHIALQPATEPPASDPLPIPPPLPQGNSGTATPLPVAPPLPALAGMDEEKTVTLHADNVDVRQVLEMFSRSHGVNLLLAPEVKGVVTANFQEVELGVALRGVLKLCNLVGHQEGALLYVFPANAAPKQDLPVRVFLLDYSSAEDLMPTVTGLLSTVGQAFISQMDPANNRRTKEAIVVADNPHALARVEQYIAQMDQAPAQVMIEAHVLEVTLNDEYRHGINYKHLFGTDFEVDVAGFANPTGTPALFARIKGSQVNGLVEWLQTIADAKTLASPRVMVLNGQQARIQVGQQIGFKVITVTQTAAVEEVKFLEVGVVLLVTPRITRDGRVVLRVKPEVSSGEINPDTKLPEEETRELETDVMLTDGQGVVIGGLIQEKDAVVQHKIPCLGDLKYVGKLFQRREIVKQRSEIVITLVPRIVDPYACDVDQTGVERTTTPLYHGPLQRLPRPWEARVGDRCTPCLDKSKP